MATFNLSGEATPAQEPTLTFGDIFKYNPPRRVPLGSGSGTGTLGDASANITGDERDIMLPYLVVVTNIIQFAAASSVPIINSTVFAPEMLMASANATPILDAAGGNTAAAQQPLAVIQVIHIILYIVCGSAIIINGGIILCFVAQNLRKRPAVHVSPAGLLVLNLLVSDALVGALGIYMTATIAKKVTGTPYGCATQIALRYLFRMGSHVALINVALDRYIAIMYTLHYREWVTMERTRVVVALGWIVPLVGTSYAILGNDWEPNKEFCAHIKSFKIFLTYVQSPSHFAALIIVVVIQCRVYLRLRRHQKVSPNQALRQYSRKSARSLFYVTTTYIVCWVPFNTKILMFAFAPGYSSPVIFNITHALAYTSFLVNPCIFSYRTENIRKPVSDFCGDLWKAVTSKGRSISSGEGKSPNVFTTGVGNSVDTSGTNTTVTSTGSHKRGPIHQIPT